MNNGKNKLLKNILTILFCLFPVLILALIYSNFRIPKEYKPYFIDLTGKWKIHEGWEKEWINPDFNDDDWNYIKLPGDYYNQGFRNKLSVFRKKIILKDKMTGKDLFLIIGGTMGSTGNVYYNGYKIGDIGENINGKKTQGTGELYGFFINKEAFVHRQNMNNKYENVIAIEFYHATPGFDGIQNPVMILGTNDPVKSYYNKNVFLIKFFQNGLILSGFIILMIILILLKSEWYGADRYKYISSILLVMSLLLYNLSYSNAFFSYIFSITFLTKLLQASIVFLCLASPEFIVCYFYKKSNLIIKINRLICVLLIISSFIINDFVLLMIIYRYFIFYFFIIIVFIAIISIKGAFIDKTTRYGVIVAVSINIAIITGVSDLLTNLGVIHMPMLFNMTISNFIILSSCVIIADFINISGTNRILAGELKLINATLEQKVEDRTGELKAANEKLKSLDRAKTTFFSNISHELRTPLTLILGPVRSIRSGEYGETVKYSDRVFGTIENNGNRLLKLINALLDFSKLEAGKMQIKKQKTDIVKKLKYYLSNIESAVTAKGLKLKFVAGEKRLDADIDRDIFEKAVYNLLSNAFKFTPAGGEITVSSRKDEKKIYISVADTGIGISEDKLRCIFVRFCQVEDEADRNYEGTGIGLALTKEIIELHGGMIEVTSSPGNGSCFTIILPVSDFMKEEDRENTGKERPELLSDFKAMKNEIIGYPFDKKRKNILVVEDNTEMLEYLGLIMENEYNVFSANSGHEAVRMLESIPRPDLIISDIMMPGMDGREFYRIIKADEKYRNILFIFLTARADHNEKIEGLLSGAVDYVCKPFDKKELLAKLRAMLANYEMHRKNIITKIIESAHEMKHKNTSHEYKMGLNSKKANLTLKEEEVFKLLTAGLENKEIAEKLGISANTVSNHVQNIYAKFEVHSRIELIGKIRN